MGGYGQGFLVLRTGVIGKGPPSVFRFFSLLRVYLDLQMKRRGGGILGGPSLVSLSNPKGVMGGHGQGFLIGKGK
jgi:hypothetical protein